MREIRNAHMLAGKPEEKTAWNTWVGKDYISMDPK
jgi:hypothetical protein